jgi:hypothetical protein
MYCTPHIKMIISLNKRFFNTNIFKFAKQATKLSSSSVNDENKSDWIYLEQQIKKEL